MTVAVDAAGAHRRLEKLFEISKLFTAFDTIEETLDAALVVIATTIPLESAVFMENLGNHTEMVVWRSEGNDPARMLEARAHAVAAHDYMIEPHRRNDAVEDRGPSTLPAPIRGTALEDARQFIVLPLVVGRQTIFGMLQLEGATRLDRDDLGFVNAIVNQLAIALDRNRAWHRDLAQRAATEDAEERVREQLAFTSALANSLGEGTLAIDLAGNVTFINEAASGLLRCGDLHAIHEAGVAVGRVETSDGAPVESPMTVAIRSSGRVRSEDHVIVTSDGSRFAASYTAAPIRRDGEVIGAVLAFDDISDRREAQEAVRFLLHASATLNVSLEVQTVASAAAELAVPGLGDVCFVDLVATDGQLVRSSWAHAELIAQAELDRAYEVAKIVSVRTPPILDVVATGRSLQVTAGDDDWFAVPGLLIARGMRVRRGLIIPLLLGKRLLGAMTFCMIHDRAWNTVAAGLAEELALRTALAIEHARLYERARQAVRLRDQTLAIVSHDLRSPLNTIVLAASLLGDGQAASPTLVKIQNAADRMDQLIDDLLDFASIESGQLAIAILPHEVTAILGESAASVEAIAHAAHVTLLVMMPPERAVILCDRLRILQVLGNLLGNAVKICRSGDRISLAAEVRGHEVVFSVADTGPGISLDNQQHLFERHWRSADASYKGTGLGLTIARGIVETHGGRIWVASELGHGATFSFTVRLA
ncbi:MAG: GAF domain-containing protein [Deltaproteobacteria bacterium]|nr:GAF domain-containing protein [Deltaproteobacteria bacterium]